MRHERELNYIYKYFDFTRYKKHILLKGMSLHGRENGEPHYIALVGGHANIARGTGVAILIRNKFNCIVQETIADPDGRFLVLKVLLNGEQSLFRNIFGLTHDSQLVNFFKAFTVDFGKRF